MIENFYIIKLNEGVFKTFLYYLSVGRAEYKISRTDISTYNIMPTTDIKILFMAYDATTTACNKIYACIASKIGVDKLDCHLLATCDKQLVIENIQQTIFLDLDKDFKGSSFLIEESAMEVYDTFVREFSKKESKDYLAAIKDKSLINYLEPMNCDCESIKMLFMSSTCREEFGRDRDRVIHSKAFRRLVDKAQIFTSQKGDHYRTRMTHTLEVSQISRSIAKRLNLNEDLTEAIALAHDIGHTPFGHQGERTIDKVLKGEYPIIKNINDNSDLRQAFKHNYQGLRVLTSLELKYADFQGLNLSYQVMEGVWKHTKLKKDKDNEVLYKLEEFFRYPNKELLFEEYEFSTTLEGQVVAVADEIAQRSHDIDDAFKAHKLDINELEKNSHIKKSSKMISIIEGIKKQIEDAKENLITLIDEHDMFRARLCSEIISYFIDNVVENSQKNIHEFYKSGTSTFYKEKHRFDKLLVTWGSEALNISKSLENLISRKVIISSEVTQFDVSSEETVLKLFEYYYKHPLSLSDNTLKRLYIEYMSLPYGFVDFRNANVNVVRNEIDKIVNIDLEEKDEVGNYIHKDREEYYRKRKLLVRCIADHIGGMTDTFAIEEYQKLYNLD